jgi:hypothetical protein
VLDEPLTVAFGKRKASRRRHLDDGIEHVLVNDPRQLARSVGERGHLDRPGTDQPLQRVFVEADVLDLAAVAQPGNQRRKIMWWSPPPHAQRAPRGGLERRGSVGVVRR